MRKILVSLISVIMSAVILINCCSCSATDIRNRMDFDETISAQEIVRLISLAINDKKMVSDAFAQIPERQRENVSYSYFIEYIDILRSTLKGRGSIESFTVLNEENSDQVINEFLSVADLSGYSIFQYGTLGVARLDFANSREGDTPFYIFISYNTDGSCYLSNEWISGVISVYNYSEHYLTMLEDENINGIYTLISPSFTEDFYTYDAIYSRAQRISDFYKLQVRSARSQYKYSTLNPFAIEVTIPETVDLVTGTVSQHSFMVKKDQYNDLSIVDNIEVTVELNSTYLYEDTNELIRIGSNCDSEQIINMFGEPYFRSEAEDGRLIYNYPGFVMTFRSTNNGNLKLISTRIYGECDYNIGGIIYLGMSLSDLLVAFPFLTPEDNGDYVLTYSAVNPNVNVIISVSDTNSINGIRVMI